MSEEIIVINPATQEEAGRVKKTAVRQSKRKLIQHTKNFRTLRK